MNRQSLIFVLVLNAVLWPTVPSFAATGASDEGQKYFLDEQPEVAADVLALRKEAKDQQAVVAVGRIGGRKKPWVNGMAVFPIVDRSLTPCNEIEGDTCRTPWDYCCETNLPKATVFVMLVDDQGKVVKQDPRVLLGVKELDTVFVQAKVRRDKSGNVTLLASRLYVPTEKQVPAR